MVLLNSSLFLKVLFVFKLGVGFGSGSEIVVLARSVFSLVSGFSSSSKSIIGEVTT